MGQLLSSSNREERWLVAGLLVSGGTSLLIAKPKVGKSTLAQNLAFSVARGEPFLSRPTSQGDVMYLALEEKKSELYSHFTAMGASPDDAINFYCDRVPSDAVGWLAAEAEARKPALIIVDTFQRFARLQNLDDYATVTNFLDPLTHVARNVGAHILFTHHERKAGGEHGDGVLGSTALFGAVDTLIRLRHSQGARTLSASHRYGEEVPETIVRLDENTYHTRACGPAAELSRRNVSFDIVEYVKRCGNKPPSQLDIYDNTQGRREVKIDALARLVADGMLVRSGSGRRGDPYLYRARDL